MQKKLISSGSPFEKEIGFSRALVVGQRVIVSGTAPIPKDQSNYLPETAAAQAHLCLRLIQDSLQEAGASMLDVVRTRVYLVDRQDWQVVARAHQEYFSKSLPASTFVVVKELLDPRWKVEIEAEAQLP